MATDFRTIGSVEKLDTDFAVQRIRDLAEEVAAAAAAAGTITGSGLTMSTARMLGRTTGGSGAIEEITVGSGLSLSAGALTATGGSVGVRSMAYFLSR